MKLIFPLLAFVMILLSCNNSGKTEEAAIEKEPPEKQSFFPVTTFLKGEIYNIKKDGINPLKYSTVNGHTDSVWLKVEELDAALAEFLHPEIDSSNLVSLFTEKSFLDQSIYAITFTYDASVPLPDSMQLKHWDVYIDPEFNTVKRIYMVKEISKTLTLQLTWVSKKWCKITSIVTDKNGETKVEKEEKIIWDF
ncbi:MAG: hypothetical protein ABI685_04455 [Ferruginibacter sp.]